ncbi:unnamed protein product [Ectocarpus fasciculatus]
MAALDPLISVRVVNVDWYLSEESKLPVVRIFGSTPAGQRSCLHLHGALPYFMVRPMEEESSAICSQFEDPGSLNSLLPQLEQALESAMASSSGGPGAPSLSPAGGAGRGGRPWGRNRQPVLARLEVVRGVPFYGYHGEEKLFVKVYMNNPALTGKVASVLQAGHVLSTRFQPFESHVPFLLQVFIDYNISGMSYVHLRNALFLQPLPELSSATLPSQEPSPDSVGCNDNGESPLTGIFTSATVPESLVANPVGQGDAWRSPSGVSANERGGGRAADGAARTATARELEPVTLRGDTDEAAQDLLAGISMSQLFSQPSIAPKVARSLLPKEGPAPRGTATSSPGKTRAGQGAATGDRPRPKWWERQTTTELEVVGIIDDVINPSLLAAGRAGDADGKPMAVASLRELWDEEKERSRVAGGGSQLSAPPGLELADSQDVWEPPELLLTQHVRDEAEGLARNVLQRATHSRESGLFPKEESSEPRSQASASGKDFDERSGDVELTPSRDVVFSQASGTGEANTAAPVADASCSPANYLPSLGGTCDHDADQGLLDMIAALRGSQQSQSQGVERESLSSPPAGQRYTRSPSGPLSQRPAFTPESSADQAEAVAATQKKQELDEEELDSRIALAAQSERHYDSDGSDVYLEPARAVTVDVSISTGNPSAAVPVPGAAGMQTPVLADPPPWSSSQRAASYPPWSQRSAGQGPARASTLPFWSQRSTEVASAGISGRLAGSDRHDGGKMDGNRLEEGEEEMDEEDEGAEDGVENFLSQLSARSLDDVKDSVQAEIDRERRMPMDPRMSPYDPLLASQAQGAEPRSQNELVDIICSQVEVEQDQNAQSSNVVADHSMDAIMEEEEEEEEEEEDGGGGRAMRTTPPRNRGDVDHRWTRGPTQLRYDDEVEGNHEGTEGGRVDMEEEEEEEEEGVRDSGTKGPLRLRGGVGLARAKPKPTRPSRAATAPEPSNSSASLPGGSSSSPRNDPDMRSGNPSAGSKRPAPASSALPKRRAPLRVPGGIRRSSSMPGVVGSFKPPRLLSTATNLPTVDEAGSAGRCGGGGDGSSGMGGDGNRCGGDNGEKSPGFVHREPRKDNPAAAGGTDSADGDGSSDTQEEDSNKDERSQVVVPGWGSQGHHPVEYSESQLSFVPSAQLRVSPKPTRGMDARTDNDVSETESVEAARKKQKVLGKEGYDRSDGKESDAARVSKAPAEQHGGGDNGVEDNSTKGESRSPSPPPRPKNPTQTEQPPLYVGTGGETTQTPALAPPRSEAGAQPRQNTDARASPEGSSSAGESGVEGRWRGADARLRLAQTRGTPSPSSHQARTDNNSSGGRRGIIGNPASGGPEFSPCSPLAPLALHQEPGTSLENDADQPRVCTNHAGGSARSSTSREGRTQAQDPPGTPLRRQGPANRGRTADSVPSAPEMAPRCDNATGASCSPAGAVAAVFPTPTPPLLSPTLYAAGRSPNTPLSAPSENSDIPPLGQPSPGFPATAATDAAAGSDTPLSDAWSSGGQRTGRNNCGTEERPSPNPGADFFLTSGSGSAASPARERFSGFTPPTPRPRGVGGRESGTVVLRPPETAPDPKKCAAALSHLGVPQVLHTEPYYSRKDDVPERPREFAGNVFRIQHKDNLKAFDTLQSRELLHAHQQAEAANATPTSPRHLHAGRSVTSSCSSYTPRSHLPDSEPRNRAVGGGGGLGAEGDFTMSSPAEHRVTGTGGLSGESYEGGGGSSGALSWTGGDAGHQEPISVRGIDEWKEAAAMFGGLARRQSRHVNRGPGRMLELVPAISPPPYKVSIRRVH